MAPDCDILIVGAGPAGGACAILLARQGYRVILSEHKSFPRHKVCGEFISGQARHVLRQLDILGPFDRHAGPPIKHVLFYPGRHAPIRAAMPDNGAGLPRAIGRDRLDLLLRDKARECGATVLQPCHVRSVDREATDRMRVDTSTHGSISAKLVVLAHGLAQRGEMRASAATGQSAGPPRGVYVAFKRHIAGARLPEHTIAVAGAAGLYAGLVRTGDYLGEETSGDGTGTGQVPARSRYALAFVVHRKRLSRFGSGADAQLAAFAKENPRFGELLNDAEPLDAWLSSGPLIPGARRTHGDGRLFVGNAAGEVHALVGEGITLALASAALVARTIARVDPSLCDIASIGPQYAKDWRRTFAPRHRAASIFAHCLMRPAIASALGRAFACRPAALDRCVAASGKLSPVG